MSYTLQYLDYYDETALLSDHEIIQEVNLSDDTNAQVDQLAQHVMVDPSPEVTNAPDESSIVPPDQINEHHE